VDAPLDRSATWPYEGGEPGRFSYARADHPTGVACEEALGALDGGYALLYPSGMAAVTNVVLTMLRPGGTIALAEGAYYGHRTLLDHLGPWRVKVIEFDQTGPPPDGVDLILVEAPANPLLTMPDFEAAAAHPAPVVCDATVSSPLRLRALEHGCDVALHSATKILSGHDDVLAGVTVASFFTAVQTFVQQEHSDTLQEVYSWILGRLPSSGWNDVEILLPYVAVAVVGILLHRRLLDVLSVGDEEAATLGVHVGQVRLVVVVCATVGTAAAVAVSGLIGFVGIIVPHAIRLVAGPSYRLLLPLSVLVGAGFLVLADVIARTALSPAELPIGVVTAFFGAPFFAIVLRTSRRMAV